MMTVTGPVLTAHSPHMQDSLVNELAEEGTATTKTNTLRALQTLKSHYDKTWSATTLDKLILIGRDALQQRNELKRRTGTNPTLDSGDLSIFFLLSDALRDRYLRLGGIHDVEEQISLFESLAQDIDFSGEGMLLQSNFGAALRDKYTCYGQSEDINRAAELHSSLLDHSPEGAVFKPRILYDLARSLHVRCQQLKGSEDFMRCVSLANEALQALPRSSPWYSRTQLSLVLSLSSRAQRGGDVSDIEKACQIAEAVVRNTSPDYPERHHAHHHLAYAHHSLYVRSSSAIHLNYCIEHWQRAIEAQDTSSRTRALHVCFLASSLRMKWASSGQLADLMNCIKILQDLNFEDVPTMNRDAYYTVLGVSLLDRADTLGSAEDLDRGVYLLRKRVAHNASPNMARTYALQSLGSALRRRYDWEKNIDDLHEAIEAGRQSLDLCTSLGISTNYITLFMLVGALSKLHQDTDSIFELYQASGLCKQWLSARNRLPVGYIQHQYLQRCGEVSLQLYSLESGLDDLNAAVSHFEEALALITAEDARADVLLDISTAKLRRFAYLGREEDEDEAMRHLEEALSLLPVGYAHRATVLFKLAEVHFANDTKHRSLPDGLARLNEALGDDYQNPQMRLTSALRLLAVVETQFRSERYFHQWRSSLLAAYIRAIKLLPRVAYFGLDADSRLQVLSSSDKLAADGAAHALLLGQPDVATEILEQGRAVFWQQYFQLRTSFHDLPKELASRLTQIATILDHRTQFHKQVASATEEVDSVEQQENEAAERRKLSREFDELLQEARSVEGFESFLLPDAFQIISIAASRGPIVVLVASELTCQAILIKSPNEVTRRDLPSLDVSKLNSLAKSFAQGTQAGRSKLRNRAIKGRMMRTHASVETVLKTLWRDCIQLVADALGLEFQPANLSPEGRNKPRLVLCPTGSFAQLPLHAAGIDQPSYSGSRAECLSDYCVVSYTPTIGAVLNCLKTPRTTKVAEAKMLLAAVAEPGGWPCLPFATHEVASIKKLVPFSVSTTFLGDIYSSTIIPSGPATANAILEELPQTTLLHLACHGYQDTTNPLDSGFVLQDRILTLEEVMSLRMSGGELAFLSACETAKGDDAQPNQAIHLAAAMLFSGFRSVVGTMWSMNDVDGPAVATVIYEALFRSNGALLDIDVVPYALDRAVRTLKSQGLSASRWAPYVHVGV